MALIVRHTLSTSDNAGRQLLATVREGYVCVLVDGKEIAFGLWVSVRQLPAVISYRVEDTEAAEMFEAIDKATGLTSSIYSNSKEDKTTVLQALSRFPARP